MGCFSVRFDSVSRVFGFGSFLGGGCKKAQVMVYHTNARGLSLRSSKPSPQKQQPVEEPPFERPVLWVPFLLQDWFMGGRTREGGALFPPAPRFLLPERAACLLY